MDWIKAIDKLPEKDGKYLVLYDKFGEMVASIDIFCINTEDKFSSYLVPDYTENIFLNYEEDYGFSISNDVKYWCEIPEYSMLKNYK